MADILNSTAAQRLDETAALLREQHANPFRISAYEHAAETLRRLDEPVSAIIEREGLDGLTKLPGVGEQLALHIRSLVDTGQLPILERLRGEIDPVGLLRTVPGIGPKSAERLHHDLGIDTLQELEVAAHDGRLRELAGFGSKRISGIIDALASRLGRTRRPASAVPAADEPPLEELLDVDREYRSRAEKGELPTIAPRRFNPKREAWLPILHTSRGEQHYTACYSNTARAHRLGTTHDWVIVYCDHALGDRQYTVVTGRRSPFAGERVVRGRELEQAAAHASTDSATPR